LLLFLAVVFEGWIGSVVVSTNLVPWVITLHMLLAMVIVAILLYLIYESRKDIFENKFAFAPRPYIRVFIVLSFILLAVQVLLGTQVREAIDMIASSLNFGSRALWISGAGVSFLVHRSFSIIVILSQVLIIYFLFRQPMKPLGLITIMMILLVCTLLEVILGAVMAYFHIPAFIQPAHLLIGVIVFGIQFLLVLVISENKTRNKPSLA
jgi:cytochrome c oxidase assembly protein subunit 15